MGELGRAAVVGAAFLAIFGAAEAWRRIARPPVELTRKLVHVGGGLVVMTFPWVFTSRWTVLGLAAAFAFLLWGSRRVGLLRSVHGVERTSEGALCYPLAVVMLFTVGFERPVLYVIAVLVLVVADTAAALLGSAYGRTTYFVEQDRRSFEGSVSFFVTTFLSVHLPLLLATDVSRGVSVLLALHVALVATLLEGVSLRGTDNLMVPLATYYLLVRLAPEPVPVLAVHLAVLSSSAVLLGVLCLKSRLMRTSGVMSSALFFYAVYLLAGLGWMVTPALALTALAALRHIRGNGHALPNAHYQVLATAYAIVVAGTLLVAHDVLPRVLAAPRWLVIPEAFLAPFVGVITGQLAVVLATQFRQFDPEHRDPPPFSLTLKLCLASIALVAPVGLWLASGRIGTTAVFVAGAIALLATVIYWSARKLPGWPAAPPWNMGLQAASTAAATLVVLPIHFRLLVGG